MPRSELMTWQSRQRRWIKKHRGKQYVVSCRQLGTAATKDASLQAANEWWKQRQKELDLEYFESTGSKARWEGLSERLSKTHDVAKRRGQLPLPRNHVRFWRRNELRTREARAAAGWNTVPSCAEARQYAEGGGPCLSLMTFRLSFSRAC